METKKVRKQKGKNSTLKIHLKPPMAVFLGGVTDTLRSSVLMRSMTGQTTLVGSRAMRSRRGSIQPAGSTLQNTGMGSGNRESGAVSACKIVMDLPDVRWEMCQFCPECVRSSPMAESVLSIHRMSVWSFLSGAVQENQDMLCQHISVRGPRTPHEMVW